MSFSKYFSSEKKNLVNIIFSETIPFSALVDGVVRYIEFNSSGGITLVLAKSMGRVPLKRKKQLNPILSNTRIYISLDYVPEFIKKVQQGYELARLYEKELAKVREKVKKTEESKNVEYDVFEKQ